MVFVLKITCLVIVLFLVHVLIKRYKYRRILRKIPSPPGHWLLGNMDFLLKNPKPDTVFNFLRECAQSYWPIYRFETPLIVTLSFLHPSDIEIILSQPKHMAKSRIYNFLQNWLGEGLLTSTGKKWQNRRKLLTQAFHFNVLQQFLKVFNEETRNMVNEIEEYLRIEKSINILPIVTNMTLHSMSETSMGIRSIEKNTIQTYRDNIHKMGELLLQRVIKPWRQIPFYYWLTTDGKVESATTNQLHEFTNRVIREREKQILDEDYESFTLTSYSGRKMMKMLDLLLYEKIKANNIDYEGIREEVDTFMFEGHDTTSAAIVFLLYCLSLYPDIQAKVREEINKVIRPNYDPNYQDLQKLSYTERVIKEALRLYPSVPFISRITSEDFITQTGYAVPKGTIVQIHIFDLHRDPRIYPDPLKFDPDRFLLENCNRRHPFAYLPFSAGPRNCIGQRFAILEIKAALTGILKKFELERDPSTTIHFLSDLILRTDGEVRIKFRDLDNDD